MVHGEAVAGLLAHVLSDEIRDVANGIGLFKAVASEGCCEACNYAREVHAGVGSTTEWSHPAYRRLYHFLCDPR